MNDRNQGSAAFGQIALFAILAQWGLFVGSFLGKELPASGVTLQTSATFLDDRVQVRSKVESTGSLTRLRFPARENDLGVANLQFRSKAGDLLAFEEQRERIGDSNVFLTWYAVAARAFEVEYDLLPKAQKGPEDWIERRSRVGALSILTGAQLTLIPDLPFDRWLLSLPRLLSDWVTIRSSSTRWTNSPNGSIGHWQMALQSVTKSSNGPCIWTLAIHRKKWRVFKGISGDASNTR